MEKLDEILNEIKDDDNFEKVRDRLYGLIKDIDSERESLSKEVSNLVYYKNLIETENERKVLLDKISKEWATISSPSLNLGSSYSYYHGTAPTCSAQPQGITQLAIEEAHERAVANSGLRVSPFVSAVRDTVDSTLNNLMFRN